MAIIDYPSTKKLALWVRDTGDPDGYQVRCNGAPFGPVVDDFDESVRVYAIERPADAGVVEIEVVFGGNDGGVSVIMDVTDPADRKLVDEQRGLKHQYSVKRVDP